MTTKEELLDGFQMIVREGLRTTASFSPDDWDYKVHTEEGGWTARQLYCHLTSTAELLPVLAGNLSQLQEGQNAAAGIDIDALNAQGVSAREQMTPQELMESFQAANEKATEFVKGIPDEQLQQRRRFGPIEAPVAELFQTFFVLHGLSHVYHAQSRPLS